jgi:hypothetical protein
MLLPVPLQCHSAAAQGARHKKNTWLYAQHRKQRHSNSRLDTISIDTEQTTTLPSTVEGGLSMRAQGQLCHAQLT